MTQTIPAGARVRILPPRNVAGNIIPDKYELAGKLGTVVKQTGESSILISLDIGGEWRVDLDRASSRTFAGPCRPVGQLKKPAVIGSCASGTRPRPLTLYKRHSTQDIPLAHSNPGCF